MKEYTVIYESGKRNWSAYVPDLPGCVATGKTRQKVEQQIREAIEFHIEGLKARGEPVPAPSIEAGKVSVLIEKTRCRPALRLHAGGVGFHHQLRHQVSDGPGRLRGGRGGVKSMAKHVFGGDWTSDKLERVRKYLCAYTTIFKKNVRASYFTTIYVDAFAGTGQRADSAGRRRKAAEVTLEEGDSDAEALQKGSARIALEVDPPFDRFLFIERSPKRVKELQKLKSEYPNRANVIQIEQGDANNVLKQWCQQSDWQRHRAVVFLDPYGMQVDWTTIEAIAATKAIDLWLLFPLGVAVNRLLTKNEPPPKSWADALTRLFGNEDWKQEFYPKKTERTLFGDEETERKEANFKRIGCFFLKRLKTVFAQVAPNPLILTNSKGVPIYLLCFAAGNPKGAPTAVKIAKDILK